jgi:hypothetical protein
MNKFLIIVIGIFFINSLSLAEIVFKNCDLSPNYGKVSLVVNLEEKQIKFENSFGIFKVLEINERNNTTLSASDNANPEIEELFLIDIKHGVIKATIKPNVIASESTKDFLKDKQTVINTICEPNNLYAKEKQQEQGVILNAAMERKITVAKRQCEMTGLKTGTDEQNHEMMGCVAYVYAKIEERNLSSKLKEKENIELKSDYESKSGEKITKDSKWQKFWSGVGWILQNHGEDIFNVILDVKYGTNYSGFNEQKVSSSGRLRCTHQRVGDIIYQNCRGGGTHIKCTYTILYETVFRKCREV